VKRSDRVKSAEEYNKLLEFLLGDDAKDYIGRI
jgi:hypothetical protein